MKESQRSKWMRVVNTVLLPLIAGFIIGRVLMYFLDGWQDYCDPKTPPKALEEK